MLASFFEKSVAAWRKTDAVTEAISVELVELGESHGDTHGLMRRLSPHLARSGRLRNRIQQLEARQTIQQIELAHLPFGLVWVGAGLQVVTQNARAVALLQEGSGICVRDNRLTVGNTRDRTPWRRCRPCRPCRPWRARRAL